MSGLLKKKETKTLEERLIDCQMKRDWAELAKTYYELGVTAMDSGDLNRAQLWLSRADTVYSAKDEVYEQVGDGIIDDCSDRIGTLEDAPLLYNDIPAKIDQAAEELSDPQIRLWGLLSIARLVSLGERLSKLPGCGVLGELGWAVDMMIHSLQEPPTKEEYQRLMDVCNALYELGDSEYFYNGGQIDVSGGAPFQVFDLNGMMGVHLELNAYIDNHMRLLVALIRGDEELPAAGSEMVGCTLLPDYYVRTLGGNPEDVPQIQAELQRIWSDYDFIRSGLTWKQVEEKLAEYKQLDILAQ